MLQKLRQVAQESQLHITHLYLGHIKRDEDRKVLAHAEALHWEEAEPNVRAIFEQHLYQAMEGVLDEVCFPCMYTGEVLSIARVASPELDRTQNRPAVELLEIIRDAHDLRLDVLTELGNIIAYKVMAAGAIRNHLVGIIKLHMVPEMGASPVNFAFATICDLDDREESLFDEMKGRFVTQMLQNVVKRSGVSRAVFFPCLDEDGREVADMLIYAGTGAAAWFATLEATRRYNARREGQSLVRIITEQNTGSEVPHHLFQQMGEQLLPEATEGLRAESVAGSVEKAVGHGIDRVGFMARWENLFGGLEYRPRYEALFGGADIEKPARMKMQAGDIQISLTPADLQHFRQVTVGDTHFILFAVPERARVVVGKDLDLKIQPVSLERLSDWMTGKESD